MSVDILSPLKAIERPVRESIRELRKDCQSLAECLEEALAECDRRARSWPNSVANKTARKPAWTNTRAVGRSPAAEIQLREQLQTRDQRLDSLKREMSSAGEQLAAVRVKR